MNVNELIQTACEDLNLTGDGETVEGSLASVCENLLNRAISKLNSDGYISSSVKTYDVVSNGKLYFRTLENGESADNNTINTVPPEEVQGVSRKVGTSYMRLAPASAQDIAARMGTYPQFYTYDVTSEIAPSGARRLVGIVTLNGSNPCELKVFVNGRIARAKLGYNIYLSDLYHEILLCSLKKLLCARYKLTSYKVDVEEELSAAMAAIDRRTLNNRPMTNADNGCASYNNNYANGMNGVGL